MGRGVKVVKQFLALSVAMQHAGSAKCLACLDAIAIGRVRIEPSRLAMANRLFDAFPRSHREAISCHGIEPWKIGYQPICSASLALLQNRLLPGRV